MYGDSLLKTDMFFGLCINDVVSYAFYIPCYLSIVLSILQIIIYFFYPNAKQHPNYVMIYRSFFDCILCFIYLLSEHTDLTGKYCETGQLLAYISEVCFIGSELTCLLIAHDLYKQAKDPFVDMDSIANKRGKILIGLSLLIALIMRRDNYSGRHDTGLCWISIGKDESVFNYKSLSAFYIPTAIIYALTLIYHVYFYIQLSNVPVFYIDSTIVGQLVQQRVLSIDRGIRLNVYFPLYWISLTYLVIYYLSLNMFYNSVPSFLTITMLYILLGSRGTLTCILFLWTLQESLQPQNKTIWKEIPLTFYNRIKAFIKSIRHPGTEFPTEHKFINQDEENTKESIYSRCDNQFQTNLRTQIMLFFSNGITKIEQHPKEDHLRLPTDYDYQCENTIILYIHFSTTNTNPFKAKNHQQDRSARSISDESSLTHTNHSLLNLNHQDSKQSLHTKLPSRSGSRSHPTLISNNSLNSPGIQEISTSTLLPSTVSSATNSYSHLSDSYKSDNIANDGTELLNPEDTLPDQQHHGKYFIDSERTINFTEHFPYVFHYIRSIYNINDQDYINELCGLADEMHGDGASGAFFFHSTNHLYMIKTIPKNEFDTLVSILKPYTEYMAEQRNSAKSDQERCIKQKQDEYIKTKADRTRHSISKRRASSQLSVNNVSSESTLVQTKSIESNPSNVQISINSKSSNNTVSDQTSIEHTSSEKSLSVHHPNLLSNSSLIEEEESEEDNVNDRTFRSYDSLDSSHKSHLSSHSYNSSPNMKSRSALNLNELHNSIIHLNTSYSILPIRSEKNSISISQNTESQEDLTNSNDSDFIPENFRITASDLAQDHILISISDDEHSSEKPLSQELETNQSMILSNTSSSPTDTLSNSSYDTPSSDLLSTSDSDTITDTNITISVPSSIDDQSVNSQNQQKLDMPSNKSVASNRSSIDNEYVTAINEQFELEKNSTRSLTSYLQSLGHKLTTIQNHTTSNDSLLSSKETPRKESNVNKIPPTSPESYSPRDSNMLPSQILSQPNTSTTSLTRTSGRTNSNDMLPSFSSKYNNSSDSILHWTSQPSLDSPEQNSSSNSTSSQSISSPTYDYFKSVTQTLYEGSYLSRYYGLYSIEMFGKKHYIVVMNNIFPPSGVNERYDLKGSYVDRNCRVLKNGDIIKCTFCKKSYVYGVDSCCSARQNHIHIPSLVYKDNDFKDSLVLYRHEGERIAAQLTLDAMFLRDHNLMDYSLLVGVKKVQQLRKPFDNVRVAPKRLKYAEITKEMAKMHAKSNKTKDQLKQADYLEYAPHGVHPAIYESDGCYYMGIIDMLTQYTLYRKIQYYLKPTFKIKDRYGVSAIPPNMYYERFLKRVIQRVIYNMTDEEEKVILSHTDPYDRILH